MSAKNKAVFLDRDGVLNREMGDYVCRVEDFFILDNFEALKTLQNKGYLLLVATNQGGLAKGWYTEEELGKMHKMLKEAYHEHGVELTDFFTARITQTLPATAIAVNQNRAYYYKALKNTTLTRQNHILLATVNGMLKQVPPPGLKAF